MAETTLCRQSFITGSNKGLFFFSYVHNRLITTGFCSRALMKHILIYFSRGARFRYTFLEPNLNLSHTLYLHNPPPQKQNEHANAGPLSSEFDLYDIDRVLIYCSPLLKWEWRTLKALRHTGTIFFLTVPPKHHPAPPYVIYFYLITCHILLI